MDVRRWSTLQSAFNRMAELAPDEQASALRELEDSDPALANDIRELLEEDARGQQLPEMNVECLLTEALHRDDLAWPVQSQIGPYRLIKLLGEGGMGVVYLAERPDIAGHVAIKLLRDAWLSPARRQRFAIEQQMLGLLNHPSVARIYDAGTTNDGTPWFAMEFSDGATITECLRSRTHTLREIMRLFRDVCEAVRYAHSLTIIHRDLKPSNILVSTDGKVKLLDFGIAKQMDLVDRGSTAATVGLRLFTPAYAAPELQSRNKIGVFTDIYSIGVILYQLITDSLPFPAGESNEHGPGRPSKVQPNPDSLNRLSLTRSEWADMDAICMKSLQNRPEDRYLSMDALIEDIDAFLEDRPVGARDYALLYSAGKFLHRNQTLVASVALGLLIVITATVVFTVRLARARDAAALARDQALAEAVRSLRMQHFTESLFTGGASYGFPPPGIKVAQMLNRGRDEAIQIIGDPRLQAAMFQSLGTSYNSLGYYSDAESLLKRAREEVCASGPPLQCADIEESLAEALSEHDSSAEALRMVKDSLRIKRARLPANDLSIAHTLTEAGLAAALNGDLEEAKKCFREGLKIAQASGKPSRELAFALDSYSRYVPAYNDPQALEIANRGAQINQQLFGRNSFEFARSEANIAQISMNNGKLKEAEQYGRASLTAVQNWSGADQPITVRYALRLVEILDQVGKFAEANQLCLRALEIVHRSNPPSSLEESDANFDLGFGEFQLGDLNGAEKHYGSVLAIAKQNLAVSPVGLEYSELGLADIYQRRGEYERAETAIHQVLAKPRFSSGYTVVAGHSLLGRVLLLQGRYQEAEAELLKAYAWFSHDPAIRPQTVQTYRDLARVEMHLGKPQESARFNAELHAHPKA